VNVTPVAKFDISATRSGKGLGAAESIVATGAVDQSVAHPLPVPSGETKTEISDPVHQAERAVGALFEDDNNPNAKFSIDMDRDSGRFVYRLVDNDTGEVVKQFPGDYVLRRIAYYRELEGIALDNQF
jgi:uncharacterized FlaG/YvyC family protein